ncbi:DNA-directed RNA polymerase subunit beta' [bacterium]|nr:DNA-directed RNA polymerase subunit beta' [bacterium]
MEELNIRYANENDAEQVANLAQESFKFNRFHLDPFIDNKKASLLYKKSAENSILHGFVDIMFVAEINEKIAGYYSAKKKYIQEERKLEKEYKEELERLESAQKEAISEIKTLKPNSLISELEYRELSMKYGDAFKAQIGAEAILELLKRIDLEKLSTHLQKEVADSSGQKKKKVLKRLQMVENFKNANLRPEWMIIQTLPVIPPDLRPMVQLDGGRFAASDLNDLYRRVINRNNRLKKLLDIGAPEVIVRNEKRMLQEAVDALIDNNARREKVVAQGATKRKLKSLSDILKGKQGRFRQNLLGKRVDYSGRSVIVVGPKLRMSQCGLPKKMAMELFKPFVISRLIRDELAHNVKSANRMIEQGKSEVWNILEEITREKYVMLNRAPTLHRLGIQAFKPILIEGKAIQIHPLVCNAFNADFDGDQMAVHLPLSNMAQKEAADIMASTQNLLKPSAGEPIVTPTQDMILGCYYLTIEEDGVKGEGRSFSSFEEAILAYEEGTLHLHAKIKVIRDGSLLETTLGRLIFNEVVPKELGYKNEIYGKKGLKKIVTECFEKAGKEATIKLVDDLKDLGFEWATYSGTTFSMADIHVPKQKGHILKEAEGKTDEVESHFRKGLLTNDERYAKVIDIWTKVKTDVTKVMIDEMPKSSSVFFMVDSGARGNEENVTQMAGMKGLVANPAGKTIELPIKANFKEGLSVLEFFIATHGARKGKSDTALRTSDSGYLTRRLVDVAQDVIVTEEDCKDKEGLEITKEETQEMGEALFNRLLGRFALEDIVGKGGKVVVKGGQEITEEAANEIEKDDSIQSLKIRSNMTCKTPWGVCQKCYGMDLARGGLVALGEAVGVIAAQSIGEPGTQLTMRTFHIGGVASEDITQGLPRVEELFEARIPSYPAVLAETAGLIDIEENEDDKLIRVIGENILTDTYSVPKSYTIKVKKGQRVHEKDVLAENANGKCLQPKATGDVIEAQEGEIKIKRTEGEAIEYKVPKFATVKVKKGDKVELGAQLTEGSLNLFDLQKISGELAVQRYIIKDVQKIYESQGQSINDKHLEIMVRQMFSRVRIKTSGDSRYLPGDVIDRNRFEITNSLLRKEKKKITTAEPMLLGITRASLATESFLSAASFQETTRELIKAATSGKVDELRGLKENVIIGKLIPAGTGFDKEKAAAYLAKVREGQNPN